MPGLWSNNPDTPEGKFPIVLRRDGTALEIPYFVMLLRDPCAKAALEAYADKAEAYGYDPEYVRDIRALAVETDTMREAYGQSDPDAPKRLDRVDDPRILAWARNLGNPGT